MILAQAIRGLSYWFKTC